MYTQNNIVLSIGTNMGDKIANIQKAINLIHNQLGSVIKISPIYQFPAWGFESEPFYNCAILIHSKASGEQAIEKVLSFEKALGRTRAVQKGYTARVIDIDIIAYNQQVYDLPNLSIPHPLMQERKFVLKPFLDLNFSWKHPILNLSIEQLNKQCTDQSTPIVVGNIACPLDKYDFSKINFLAIEGNIGAGKTTLSTRISEDFNAKNILEGFADNPFLPKFYQDAERYAFPLEMSFLADRYSQLSDDLSQLDLFKEFVIADYYVHKSLIFAQITLEPDEFRLYKQVFEIMYKETPRPDLYVFLYQNTNRLLENIQKRGRSYEADITANYLDKVTQGYLKYIKTLPENRVLLIDISDLDFVAKQQDYIQILELIHNKITQITTK
ncbi:2-amino-4-hydroxy-6-hydroxymethyldihydropteridine diphosphokinase [Myroides sp. LJL119]